VGIVVGKSGTSQLLTNESAASFRHQELEASHHALHLGVTEATHQPAQSSRMRMGKDIISSKPKGYKPAPCRISFGSPI
jgi:hypothetical protein